MALFVRQTSECMTCGCFWVIVCELALQTGKHLNRETELKQVQLTSPNQPMDMWGLQPTQIIELCQSAVGFYVWQFDLTFKNLFC